MDPSCSDHGLECSLDMDLLTDDNNDIGLTPQWKDGEFEELLQRISEMDNEFLLQPDQLMADPDTQDSTQDKQGVAQESPLTKSGKSDQDDPSSDEAGPTSSKENNSPGDKLAIIASSIPIRGRSRKHVAPPEAYSKPNDWLLANRPEWLADERLLEFLLEHDLKLIATQYKDETIEKRKYHTSKTKDLMKRALEDRARARNSSYTQERIAFNLERKLHRQENCKSQDSDMADLGNTAGLCEPLSQLSLANGTERLWLGLNGELLTTDQAIVALVATAEI